MGTYSLKHISKIGGAPKTPSLKFYSYGSHSRPGTPTARPGAEELSAISEPCLTCDPIGTNSTDACGVVHMSASFINYQPWG